MHKSNCPLLFHAPALLLAAQMFTAGFEARAADFTVNTPTTVTNGLAGRELNSNDNLTITPAGSITTTSANGIRVVTGATNNRLVNNGAITTTGASAIGILGNDNGTITNSGDINTTLSSAIQADSNNQITNSGNIIAENPRDNGAINILRADNNLSNTGRIIATIGKGISGSTNTASFTTLRNTVNPATPGSGLIQGSTHGIAVRRINNLTNNAGAIIEGLGGAGITLNGTSGEASATNLGTIRGTTYGMNHGALTLAQLTNSGLIEGNSQAALAAAAITRLDNQASGRIISKNNDAIRSAGVIGRLNNSSEILGGSNGIRAASVGRLTNNSGALIKGTSGDGINSMGAITDLTNSSRIEGGQDGIQAASIGTLRNNSGALIKGTSGDGINSTGAITDLTNSGEISGGQDGIQAASIGTLRNNSGALIKGTSGDGINSTGAITDLTNSGEISGGEDGIQATSIGTLRNNSGALIKGTSGDGIRTTGAIGTLNNNGEISGGQDGIQAVSIGLSNSGDIRAGISATGHGVNLGAGDSTIDNTGKITSARGRGINGLATSILTTLSNTVNPAAPGSGLIRGSTDGIAVGRINNLTNNAGATIEGLGGAGITLNGTSGEASATNLGTIKGTTFGMNYGNITLTQLTNSGRIEGGNNAALAAAVITRLNNQTGGKIVSTSGDGIRSAGAIGTLNNSGEISGGEDGIQAASIGRLINNARAVIKGTGGDGIKSAGAITRLTNSGEISGDVNGISAASIGSVLDPVGLINNAGAVIKGTGGDGIKSTGAITRLTNSGRIEGGMNGISATVLGTLINNAGALIEGQTGAGLTLSGTTGNASATNRGTIRGATFGMNYGNTLTRLTNSGLIEGGTQAAVSAAAITRLDNQTGGRIVSTSGDGIRSVGAIGTLNNSGEITGGQDGIEAASIGTLTNNAGAVIEGKAGAGITLSNTAGDVSVTNLGTIRGTTFGMNYNGKTLTLLTNSGLIQGGTQAAVAAGDITRLDNNASGRIVSTSSDAIRSLGDIGALNNSGQITGGTNGISAISIGTLINNVGAMIEGQGGAGITLNDEGGNASATNRGTIKGTTFGMNYGDITLTRLTNSGRIEGGSEAAIAAAAITRLDNQTGGRITSSSSDAIRSAGAIGTLNNSGQITGGQDGIEAASIGTLTNNTGALIKGTNGDGIKSTGAITRLTNSGEISGGVNGISAVSLNTLINNAGATIEGKGGAGITLSGTTGDVSVTNRGTIRGTTHGMNYNGKTLTRLTNSGLIQGDSEAAVLAARITRLDNQSGGRIISKNNDGVRGRLGAIGELTNRGEISGGRHGINAVSIGTLLNDAGAVIKGTNGDGILSPTGTITRLTNSGRIEGGTNGISASSIVTLINNAGAVIEGKNGAGITLSNTAGDVSVTNRGTIKGTTFGMNYGAITLTQLTNSGRIEGESEAAVAAAAIGTLNNFAAGRIISTLNDAIRSAGAITELNNLGEITGGGRGISAGSIGTLRNNNLIQGGTGAGVSSGDITRLDNNAGGRILSTSGDGIDSTGDIGTLNNRAQISGGGNGVKADSLATLFNDVGALIEGKGGAGLALNGTAGNASVINRGTIKGATFGMNYGNTLTLTNSGLIQGGNEAAVSAAITRLDNETGGRITSRSSDAIRSAGAITELNNSGQITGGRDGIEAGSIVTLTNNAEATIEGKGGAGINITSTMAGDASVTNLGTIKGTTYGMNYNGKTLTLLTNSGLIQGGSQAAVAAAAITRLTNVAAGRITSTLNDAIRATGAITRLTNSGRIEGGTNGISASSIVTLINNAGAVIEGKNGAGITLSNTAGDVSVTNRGTIKGTTYGMNYDGKTLTQLTNSGRIEGESEAAVAAAAIGTLNNFAAGRIISTNNDAIRSAGAITELNNSGEITGGRDGIRAASIGSLTNNAEATIEGKGGAGINITSATAGNASVTNLGTIKGTTYGMNYNGKTLTLLANGGLIQGGNEAAVSAAAITRLDNVAAGRITSTNNDAIRVTGAITELNNLGEITGGGRGISAGSIGTLRNNNLIQGGTGAGVSSGDITRLDNNAAGRIVSTSDDGIRSTGAIGTLNNSGEITGGRDGIRAASIGSLTNNAEATIEGKGGAGINITSTTAGNASVTNLGTIKGTTYGMNYNGKTLTLLSNSGLIQGGNEAAVSAAAIGTLNNVAAGRITSTLNDGIRSVGEINELNNSGEITGGRHGISAASVGLLNNTGIIRGRTSGVNLTGSGSRIANRGQITASSGDGIGGEAASSITTLINQVGAAPGSGVIRGADNGIQVGRIGSLTNNAGAIIEGRSGAGITLNGASGNASVTNRGTIKGTTYGMNYGNISLTQLTNSGRIEGGSDAALAAAAITRLDNEAGGEISSTSGDGIRSEGAIGTLNNSGEITGGQDGIEAGSIGRLTNNNLIQAGTGAGVSSNGGITRLDNNTDGRIVSTNGDGIRGAGALGTLNNSGEIRGGRDGIRAGSVGTLSNRKTIQGGAGGAGLNVSGEVATLTNHRGAEITGGGDGVRAGSLNALTNDGRIISASGGGVTLTGRSDKAATVVNNGTIQGATHGMDYGENTIASLTNTSAQSIRGGTGDGLRAHALRRLNNSGTIISSSAGGVTLTGRDAVGAEYTNSGRIEGRTHGLDYGDNALARLDNTASGILRSGEGAAVKGRGALRRLENRGTIEGKTGIELRREARAGGSGGATIDNYGLLRGTGGTALGLFGSGRDNLRLFEGSRLEGLVRWDGLGDTFFYAPREPGIYSFRDSDAGPNSEPTRFNIEAPAQQTILRSTVRSPVRGEARTTVAFVDSSLYALAGNTLSRWTGSVAEALAQQTRSEGPGGAGREFWLRPFAGYQRFGREGLRPSARHDYLGGVAGFSLSRGMARIGFFGGGATAEVEVSGVGRDQASSSFFAGAYAHGPVRGLHLHGAVLVGQSRFESVWGQVNSLAAGGRERVGVDYDSLFLSPQIGLLAGGFDLLGLTVRPAVQLRYLARFTDDHAYEPVGGGSALLRIKAHDVHMGLLRAELRAPGRLWKGEHGRLHGEMRLGAEGGMVFAGREIPVRLGGGDTAFKAGRGHSATGFIGAGLRYSMPRLNLTLSADVEGSYDSDSATSVWGQVGLEWEF